MRKAVFAYYYAPGFGPDQAPKPAGAAQPPATGAEPPEPVAAATAPATGPGPTPDADDQADHAPVQPVAAEEAESEGGAVSLPPGDAPLPPWDDGLPEPAAATTASGPEEPEQPVAEPEPDATVPEPEAASLPEAVPAVLVPPDAGSSDDVPSGLDNGQGMAPQEASRKNAFQGDIPRNPPAPLPAHLAMPGLSALPHDVLGLFAPEVISIQARSGVGGTVAMGLPNAGMYRPDGFRPAPWSGLAYEMAPDDGRGICAGTRLLTARGEVAVEQLLPSDRVLGLRGPKLARIATITRRPLSSTSQADLPVHIAAGAFGPDQPSRDLLVGPDQVVFPDGAEPVLARLLPAQKGLPEQAYAELFQVALVPYPGAEDGDVLLADGVFIASRSHDDDPMA